MYRIRNGRGEVTDRVRCDRGYTFSALGVGIHGLGQVLDHVGHWGHGRLGFLLGLLQGKG